jgi:enamine deaminase RidA (YjgF/YER057c/UK114 family)
MRSALTSARARAVGPYSHGIVFNPFVYLPGQTPLDPDSGALVGGGVGTQTAQCFDNLLAVLADSHHDRGRRTAAGGCGGDRIDRSSQEQLT